ncbi:hypothetical protein DFJ74DRAFT_646442 [Hyaloraphidium curvatum]|nr:hypothetical protein DFJ74DRAFT_646442 [Hyaloraphidium curvatum]
MRFPAPMPAIAAFLLPLLLLAAPAAGQANCTGGTLRTCLSRALGNNVQFPGSAAFEANYPSWQWRHRGRPAAVMLPRTAAHVAAAFRCASSCAAVKGRPAYRVTARSGGHSFEGYSSGSTGFGGRGAVVVDLRNFRQLNVRPGPVRPLEPARSGIAEVGAGWKLGPVYLALYRQATGPWLLPGGTCPGVGVGQVLAGGVGNFGRMFGVLSNALVEVEIVVPDGRTLRVRANSTGPAADLWWALRGGGQNNFGIATRFWFTVHRVPNNLGTVFFSLKWPGGVADRLAPAYYALASSAAMHPNVTTEFNWSPNSPSWSPDVPSTLFLVGFWYGTSDTSAVWRLLKPLTDAAGMPTETDVRAGRYIDALLWNSWVQPAGPAPSIQDLSLEGGAQATDGHLWKASSLVLPSAPRPNGPFYRALLETVGTRDAVSRIPWDAGIINLFTLQVLWGGPASHITNPSRSPFPALRSPSPSAFVHQGPGTFSSFELQIIWERGDCPRCLAWHRAAFARIIRGYAEEWPGRSGGTAAAYYNYLDGDATPLANGTVVQGAGTGGPWPGEAYFGQEGWARLRGLKRAWDPRGVMSFARGVPLLPRMKVGTGLSFSLPAVKHSGNPPLDTAPQTSSLTFLASSYAFLLSSGADGSAPSSAKMLMNALLASCSSGSSAASWTSFRTCTGDLSSAWAPSAPSTACGSYAVPGGRSRGSHG